jgi:uncharacterized protein (TIGR02145 family)
MDSGDVLSMLFLDESGTPTTFTLNSIVLDTGEDNIDKVPDAPIALPASDITSTGFTANWNFMENTLGFRLDVATDSAFTSFVAGYNNLNVGLVDEYPVVGLTESTTYYYRIRAYNDVGASVSSGIITMITMYGELTIGTQVWANSNYAVNYLGSKAYNDNESNVAIYGRLYSAIMALAGDFVPVGWHVPTKTEFDTLITFLGGSTVAGGHLKEAGVTHWNAPNLGADNTSNFTALPGGYYDPISLIYGQLGFYGYFLTSTPHSGSYDVMFLSKDNADALFAASGGYYSVRFIKD